VDPVIVRGATGLYGVSPPVRPGSWSPVSEGDGMIMAAPSSGTGARSAWCGRLFV
jgi:hypothetical protein